MPAPPTSHETQPPASTDSLAWRRHIPALATAAAGIRQASDAWDAVSGSFCDHDGWPDDLEEYADGKAKRDAEAWKHVEVFLAHGPEVLAGVRAAATGTDYVEEPISDDLRRLREINTTLERAGQFQHEWDQVMAPAEGSQPSSFQLYERRAEDIRNAEGWHYADKLSFQGPALVRAADYLADRIQSEQPSQTDRAQVALAQTHRFLESTANWCRDRGALASAGELELRASLSDDLIDDAQLLPESLVTESAAVSRDQRQEQAARLPSPTASTTKPAPVLPAGGPPAAAAAPVAVRRR